MPVTIDAVDESVRGVFKLVLAELDLAGKTDFRSFQHLPAVKVARINDMMTAVLEKTTTPLPSGGTTGIPPSLGAAIIGSSDSVVSAINTDTVFRAGSNEYWRDHKVRVAGRIGEDPGMPYFYQLDESIYPSESRWPISTFYIGPVPVVNPTPIGINIAENFDFQGPEAIRTDTEPLIPSNRSRTRISVNCIYPSTLSINRFLRHTLAHLRAAPITVLQGALIRDALLRQYRKEDSFKLSAQVARDKAENAQAVKRLLVDFGLDPDDPQTRARLKELLADGSPLAEKYAELAKTEKTYPSPTTPWRPESSIVPVVFDSVKIESMRESPEGVSVTFNFWMINELSVSSYGIRFKDADGQPTHDISKCTWLHRYAELAYMKESNIEYGGVYLKPLTGGSTNQLVIDFQPLDPASSIYRMIFDTNEGNPNAFKRGPDGKEEPTSIDKHRQYCVSVVTSSQTKTALVPLVGQDVPSVQYMGRKNAVAQVVLNCNSEGVKQIQEMNTIVQANLRSVVKIDREQFLTITNPILNLSGLTKFVLAGITINTIDSQPGRFMVTLDLIENRVFTKSREQLVFHVGKVSKPIAKSFWDYMINTYENWRNGKVPKEDPEAQQVLTILFGKDRDGKNCVLNKEVAAAFLGRREDLLIVFLNLYKQRALIEPFLDLTADLSEQIKRDVDYGGDERQRNAIRFKEDGLIGHGLYKWGAPGADFIAALLVEDGHLHNTDMDDSWERLIRHIVLRFQDGGLWTMQQPNWNEFFEIVWDRDLPKVSEDLHNHIQALEDWKTGHLKIVSGGKGLYSGYLAHDRDPSDRVLKWDSIYVGEEIDKTFNRLRATVLYFSDEFPSWTQGRKAKEAGEKNIALVSNFEDKNAERRAMAQLSTYPDMFLPTYAELFTLPGARLNPTWENFAPTWGDIGRKPTPSKYNKFGSILDVYAARAVDETDLIEPWFFYHSMNYKQTMLEAQRASLPGELIGAAIRDSTIKTDWKYYNEEMPSEFDRERIMDWLEEATKEKGSNYKKAVADKVAAVKGDSTHPPIYLMASDRNLPIGWLVPSSANPSGYELKVSKGKGRLIYDQDDNELYDAEGGEHVERQLQAQVEHMDVKQHDIRRCFPTFRLRFIDFNTGIFSDNLYDYNAVKSISITHDKYDAGLAMIELMNLSGNLDTDQFMSDAEMRARGMPAQEEGEDKDDETQGQVFKRIKVKEGTAIQIMMGYSPRVQDLQVVFTGRISQLQPGDVMIIVAQDYKTELLNEVTFHDEEITPKGVVEKVFQHMDGEYDDDDRDDIEAKDRRNGTPHLGSRVDAMTDKSAQKLLEYMSEVFGKNKVKVERVNNQPVGIIHGMRFQDLFSDLPYRMHNVSFEHQSTNRQERDWVAVYQPGFDVLRELARMTPGWVCQVLPFDHMGTLYIGPTDGFYRYTNQYNRDVIENLRRIPPTVGAKFKDFLDFATDFHSIAGIDAINKRLQTDGIKPGSEHDASNSWKYYDNRSNTITYDRHSLGGSFEKIISILSDSYGDMSDKVVKVRETAPALWEFMVPAYFGFDNVNAHNIPRGVQEAFFVMIMQILSNQGEETVGNNMENYSGFDVKYIDVPDATDPTLRAAVHTVRFWGLEDSVRFNSNREVFKSFSIHRIEAQREKEQFLREHRGKSLEEAPGIFAFVESHGMADITSTIRNAMLGDYDRFRVWFDQLYSYVVEGTSGVPNILPFRILKTLGLPNPIADSINKSAGTLKLLNENLSDIAWNKQRPDYKPFRDMHLAMSRFDIVQNNIVASTKEMHNTVLLRYPTNRDVVEKQGGSVGSVEGRSVFFLNFSETDWTEIGGSPYGIPFHNDLKLEERKLLVALEKNAYGGGPKLNIALAGSCFLNRMGEALQPMYRGNILLWGRNIKPYDWINVVDQYNEMKGVIEADRVVHNFNTKTGWTTMIIPHAVVHVNQGTSVFQKSSMVKFMEGLGVFLDVLTVGSIIFSIVTLGTGASAVAAVGAARTVAGGILKSKLKGALVKEALKQGGKKLMASRAKNIVGKKVTGAMAKEAIKSVSLTEVSKYAGLTLATHFKAALPSIGWWSLLDSIKTLPPTLAASIAHSTMSESLNGIVSITPLYYQGRPLVAGLSTDDTKYITKWEGAWRSLKDMMKGGYEYLTESFRGEDGEVTIDLTEYNRVYQEIK